MRSRFLVRTNSFIVLGNYVHTMWLFHRGCPQSWKSTCSRADVMACFKQLVTRKSAIVDCVQCWWRDVLSRCDYCSDYCLLCLQRRHGSFPMEQFFSQFCVYLYCEKYCSCFNFWTIQCRLQHVEKANDMGAIGTLMVTDELFRLVRDLWPFCYFWGSLLENS